MYWNSDGDVFFTGDQPSNYSTALIGNASIDWLQKVSTGSAPFHVFIAPHAPHAPYTPAPWYANVDVPFGAPRTESYGYKASTHVPWMAQEPIMTAAFENTTDITFKKRWRTLLSVDDIVADVFAVLEQNGVLDNTFVFFTSDHGFHMGQFRLAIGKDHFYDTDVRVPMFVRGPGITPNTSSSLLGAHVDLAPTFLDLAGQPIPPIVDGKSIVPFLINSSKSTQQWRDAVLVEYYSLTPWPTPYIPELERINDCPNNTHRSLRINSPELGFLKYAEITEVKDWFFKNPIFYELYNLTSDPEELVNLYYESNPQLQQTLHSMIVQAWECKGNSTTPSNCQ